MLASRLHDAAHIWLREMAARVGSAVAAGGSPGSIAARDAQTAG
jgi:hypothetical protein